MKTTISLKLIVIVSILYHIQGQCLVDKCANCTNPQVITCNTCETGWYLRKFTGGDKEYHECWSLTKLWLGLIGGLLLALLLCGLCYYCYLIGKRSKIGNQQIARDYMMTEPQTAKEQPIYVQSTSQEARADPTTVYSPPRAPIGTYGDQRLVSRQPMYSGNVPSQVVRRY